MPDERTILLKILKAFQDSIIINSTNFDQLDVWRDQIILQLNQSFDYINESSFSDAYLSIIQNLQPYIKDRNLFNLFIKPINNCLQVAKQLGSNLTWIHLLLYDANFALGDWEQAKNHANEAVFHSNSDIYEHAESIYALGRLQMNLGDYKNSINNLEQARKIYQEIGEQSKTISVDSEIGTYYHYQNKHKKTVQYFEEIRQNELRNDNRISNHTLLLLGVAYRRMSDNSKAIELLAELFMRVDLEKATEIQATAAHHLAWAYLNIFDFHKAEVYAKTSEILFTQIQNPRGVSDTKEQFGMIAFKRKEYDHALEFLFDSLLKRQELGNQQGAASTLSRISRVYFCKIDIVNGCKFLFLSLKEYNKLGLLSYSRFFNMFWHIFKVTY